MEAANSIQQQRIVSKTKNEVPYSYHLTLSDAYSVAVLHVRASLFQYLFRRYQHDFAESARSFLQQNNWSLYSQTLPLVNDRRGFGKHAQPGDGKVRIYQHPDLNSGACCHYLANREVEPRVDLKCLLSHLQCHEKEDQGREKCFPQHHNIATSGIKGS